MTGCGGKTEDGKVTDKGQPEANKNEAAVVSANQLVAKGKAVDGYSYDYILTMPDGKKITHKMWLKAGNMRSEMSNPVTGEPMLSIVNLTDKAVFLYQPELKQATKMSIDQSEVDTTSPGDYLEKVDPAGMMFMKREHFDGKECLVYEMNTSGMSGKMWIWEDHGMPLRVESQAGQDKVVVEFLNFKIGDIDDSLFKLPAGTEIVDLGAMLKQ
jgi:outer membrane lipoprotein-sorting protein